MPGSPDDGADNGRHARLCLKLQPAFAILLQAFEYAEDANTEPWQFAVGIRCLQELGLGEIDLLWLLRKEYVNHAREITVAGDKDRQFRPCGATLCEHSCFVLAPAAVATARLLAADHPPPSADGNLSLGRSGHTANDSTPHWDSLAHELSIDGKIVKYYKWPAPNQQIVLDAFQEEGWPARIDDPLPPQPGLSSKQRLSDTIKCLNRGQINSLLRFRGDGTGEGIVWERLPNSGENGR